MKDPREEPILHFECCILHSRKGFTFLELLFAIIILGVGMVMIAGMFPVAIRMTQATRDDTVAATIVRSAAEELGGMLTDDLVEASGGAVRPFTGRAWDAIRGNVILNSDPRFAWVPLYRRSNDAMTAQLFLIAVKSRGPSHYGTIDLLGDPDGISGAPANLEPRGIDVEFLPGGADPDVVRIDPSQHYAGAAAEGAFVILANDQLTGTFNGHVYRLGTAKDPSAGLWYLQPGYDLKKDARRPRVGHAFIVGRGYADPAHPELGFQGEAQDLAFFTMIVPLRE